MGKFIAGVEDGNGGISIYYELGALMKTIKLPMAKWATSCEELKEIWKGRGSGDSRDDASSRRRLEYRIRHPLGGSQGHSGSNNTRVHN